MHMIQQRGALALNDFNSFKKSLCNVIRNYAFFYVAPNIWSQCVLGAMNLLSTLGDSVNVWVCVM